MWREYWKRFKNIFSVQLFPLVLSPLALVITTTIHIYKESASNLRILYAGLFFLGVWGVGVQIWKIVTQSPEREYIENFGHIFDEILSSIHMEAEHILEGRNQLNSEAKSLLTSLRLTLFIKDPVETKYIKDKTKEDWKLIIVGRYASYETRKDTRVSFCINKGACGRAFKLNQVISVSMGKYSEDPESYYTKAREIFNMTRKEVDSLSKKSGFYLAIPVKEISSNKVVGALVIDTEESVDTLPENIQRVFEDLLSYQVQRGFYRKTLSSLINKVSSQVSSL